MKRLVFSVLGVFLSFSLPSTAKSSRLALSVNSEAAILMNADTGAILFEKNAYELHYPASITKIVTAICALQKVGDRMDELIAADQECIGTMTEAAIRRSNYTVPAYTLIPDGSHIGIKKGEILSLKDLMYGMMLASGDDAANVIAKFSGGTIPKFVEEMNAFATQAGSKSTTFYNPHGLHHPKQQTTAYDMAMITRQALKNPTFREIVSTVSYTRPKTNKQEPTTLIQTNRLLRNGPYYYPKAIGVKTGYYSTAGSTLVAAAKDGDRTLIAVVMKAQERKDIFQDAKKMFEAAFSQPKVQRVLLDKGPQKFTLDLPGAQQPIASYLREGLVLEYYSAEEPNVKCLLSWDKKLKLPVAKDQKIGELIVQTDNGTVLRTAPLYAQDAVDAGMWFRIKNNFSNGQTGRSLGKIAGSIALCTSLGYLLFYLRRRKR